MRDNQKSDIIQRLQSLSEAVTGLGWQVAMVPTLKEAADEIETLRNEVDYWKHKAQER